MGLHPLPNVADVLSAVQAAMAGDWQTAHTLTQRYQTPSANWLHAVLHKMEGDVANSHYWYARSGGHQYDTFANIDDELAAIHSQLLALSA